MHFDALRLLFATFVIFAHSFELIALPDPLERLIHGTTSLGGLGVYGFFLISGYLITQSWMSDPSTGRYLARRILRLHPAFIVASVVSVFIVGPLGAPAADYFQQLDLGRFLRGLATLHDPQTPQVFAGSVVGSVNGAMWTISFEFRCYLLVIVLASLGVFRVRWVLLGLAAVAGVTASIGVPQPGPMDAQHMLFGIGALRLSDFMLWFAALFLTGSCFYLYRDRIRYTRAGGFFALAVLFVSLFHLDTLRPGVLLAGAYLVFGMASVSLPAVTWRGPRVDASYGLYLYGWPVTKLLSWYVPGIGPWTLFAGTFCASLALATLSWRFIEAPALRLKPIRPLAMLNKLEISPV